MAESVQEHGNQRRTAATRMTTRKERVEPAHRPDDPPHRAQHRLGSPVEEALHPGQRGPGVDPEPAQERRGQHDEPQVQLDEHIAARRKRLTSAARVVGSVAPEAALNQSLPLLVGNLHVGGRQAETPGQRPFPSRRSGHRSRRCRSRSSAAADRGRPSAG